MLLASTSPTTL
jgi:hypothetical protein